MTINVKVSDLRRAYNRGRAQGQTDFPSDQCPTYLGRPVNFVFGRNTVVDYTDAISGKLVARFQDVAAIDD